MKWLLDQVYAVIFCNLYIQAPGAQDLVVAKFLDPMMAGGGGPPGGGGYLPREGLLPSPMDGEHGGGYGRGGSGRGGVGRGRGGAPRGAARGVSARGVMSRGRGRGGVGLTRGGPRGGAAGTRGSSRGGAGERGGRGRYVMSCCYEFVVCYDDLSAIKTMIMW